MRICGWGEGAFGPLKTKPPEGRFACCPGDLSGPVQKSSGTQKGIISQSDLTMQAGVAKYVWTLEDVAGLVA